MSPHSLGKRSIAKQQLKDVKDFYIKTTRRGAQRSPLGDTGQQNDPVSIVDSERIQAQRMEHFAKLGSLRDFISTKERKIANQSRGFVLNTPDIQANSLNDNTR